MFFFVNIGENLVPFMGINILMWKKLTHRKIIIIWKPIAQTLYIKHRLFIMNKATSVQSYGDMAYNLPLIVLNCIKVYLKHTSDLWDDQWRPAAFCTK